MPTDRRLRRNCKTIGLASFALISLLAADPSAAEIKTITATDNRTYAKSSNDPISAFDQDFRQLGSWAVYPDAQFD